MTQETLTDVDSMNGGIRASDADRDQVVELLHRAYAEGRLSLEEHQDRTEIALAAKTFDELNGLTTDLVHTGSPGPHAALVPLRPGARNLVVTDGAIAETDNLTAILSDTKRQGTWRIRHQTNARSLMGSVRLDLTEATFDAPTVYIDCTTLLGDVTLRVPVGVTIIDEVTQVLASTSIKDIGEPDAAMPTIVLRGTNILSEIKVRGPRKPSRWTKALES